MHTGITRGTGDKAVKFQYELSQDTVVIDSESGMHHEYTREELAKTLGWLKDKFSDQSFPLANNVAKLGSGEERDGLAVALYGVKPETSFAQGGSYLGVVLEHRKVFDFVQTNPIQWRFNGPDESIEAMLDKIFS